MSPFQVLYGRLPPDLIPYPPGSSNVAAVDEVLVARDTLIRQLKDNLAVAKARMEAKANKKRREVNFQPGDQVLVKLRPYRQISVANRLTNKLSKRYYGPFEVIERVGKVAYRLALPPTSKIHPVFHVSILKPFNGDAQAVVVALPADVEKGQPVEQPLAICGSCRVLRNGAPVRQVLVQWTGRSPTEATWEYLEEFQGAYPTYHLEDKVFSEGEGNDTTGDMESRRSTTGDLEPRSFSNLSSSLKVLQYCLNLTVLVLTTNFYDEQLPPDDALQFKALKALVIANYRLTGSILPWLNGLTQLQLLDLSWNHLTGSIPTYLGDFRSLFYLDLSNNSLSGEIPKNLTQLQSLISSDILLEEPSTDFTFFKYKDMSMSRVTYQYKQITTFPPFLDLSSKLLTGRIWLEFGNLKNLHILDLNHNNLSSSIPGSLSSMIIIETLDLSFNSLTGTVPASLVSLTFFYPSSVLPTII
ncbi:unnamed protein product [Lactuca virosa]|uniref:Tf2-1-like SH3-like domain-containing protein n=1 Tax=Lactuca virosa TaxID=75947 RepID=A0AAU9LT59_9ASTR|nr:unnamed protein product [Lactuca virosa]